MIGCGIGLEWYKKKNTILNLSGNGGQHAAGIIKITNFISVICYRLLSIIIYPAKTARQTSRFLQLFSLINPNSY